MIGGSVESCSLGGRYFAVTADADSNFNPGGFENTMSPNGDGTMRVSQQRVGWSVEGLVLVINEENHDDVFLKDLVARAKEFTITIAYRGGTTKGGMGQIMGTVSISSMNLTSPINLGGGGEFITQ